jgi:hypothetical protein
MQPTVNTKTAVRPRYVHPHQCQTHKKKGNEAIQLRHGQLPRLQSNAPQRPVPTRAPIKDAHGDEASRVTGLNVAMRFGR